MARPHTRIIQHPFAVSLQGALLDSYEEERVAGELQIALKLRALEHTASEIFERDGMIYERIQGSYVPAQLRFSGISELRSSDFSTNLANLPHNDPTRTINDMLSWRQPEMPDVFYLFFMQALNSLMFFARHVIYTEISAESTPVTLERDWSSPPPMPERMVPKPEHLHRRFGGDPITIKRNGKVFRQKLFIGGLEIQPDQRPQVDAILNLGEEASRWVKGQAPRPNDRTIKKGEGSEGMSVAEIREEASWIVDHLLKNESVLVHCVAGMNRSATICCAVLILLEGLSATAALERVREHHPWARPDSHHWLALRWLARSKKE